MRNCKLNDWALRDLIKSLRYGSKQFGVETPTFYKSAAQVIYLGIFSWLEPYSRDLNEMISDLEFDKGHDPTLWSALFTWLDGHWIDWFGKVSPAQYTLANKLCRALRPYHELKENGLSTKQYTCGDLVRDLLSCESVLKSHNDEVSTALLESMRVRKGILLENIQFQAALYLDPRFNNCHSEMLTNEQKINVVNYLVKVYEKIKDAELGFEEEEDDSWDSESDIESEIGSETEQESDDDSDNETDDEADDETDDDSDDDSDDEEPEAAHEKFTLEDLKKVLKDLENHPEPSPGIDIKEHWLAQSHPQLVELANVVLAHPVSLVPVRDFDFNEEMNAEEAMKNSMKMYLAYTEDM